ncbi:hypothetical protein D9757_012788 [Collybiopsis confluens]|uniref:DUF6533 domain-containing protein n=1 Tax=Collybiopsis confluens TaxID=2823264 RepID=A0A8H5CWK1_9AGAR|nr:hypothetical protein D9757_012788 [Collybiopsis confluens]
MPLLDLENIQTAVNWERYIALVQFILLVYEWFLTLNEEIEFFWQQDCKSRIPAILFYVNRYLTLLGNVPIFVLVFWPGPIYPSFPELGREQLDIYMEVLVLVIQLNIMGVLSAFSPCEAVEAVINLFAFLVLFVIRVTALYGGSWRVRALLSGLGLGAVSNAAQLYLGDREPPSVIMPFLVSEKMGNIPLFTDLEQPRHFTYIWIGFFAFDLSVFLLTLWKTYQMFRLHWKYTHGTISGVITRDGLLYFGAISAVTLGNILILVLGTVLIKGILVIFSSVLPSILMSRLMLNLRRSSRCTEEFSSQTQLSDIRFFRSTRIVDREDDRINLHQIGDSLQRRMIDTMVEP